ncbi:hypothetical protein [Rummeliibacillus stabekisii]|uniref:Uncharacterized protein n=1 Tax=Rummeliibacillus stabekisii TaxID=241244 RepID=A0A143HAU9_9BACL|nr:hypothetical protein [Rummeliibacillus stabekisii]AMW98461.1 hypothetical protein ATY39_02830 [Rummeliibacillus stabekisii]
MVIVFKWKSGGEYLINENQVSGDTDFIKWYKEMDEEAEIEMYGKKYSKSELESVEILFNKKVVDNNLVDIK